MDDGLTSCFRRDVGQAPSLTGSLQVRDHHSINDRHIGYRSLSTKIILRKYCFCSLKFITNF